MSTATKKRDQRVRRDHDMTAFQERVLRTAAACANGIGSTWTIASNMRGWGRAAARGALVAHVRRAAHALEQLGLAGYSPGSDRWDAGKVFVSQAGLELIAAIDRERAEGVGVV